MTLITFTAVLWGLSGSIVIPIFGGITIPGYMLWVALLYSGIGTWLTFKIGRPLVRVNFEMQRFNADFRYRMTRIRENAEPIALYKGEPDEASGLSSSFSRVYGNWWAFMKYNKRLNWLTSFYGQVASIFPIIVAAPRYFAGLVPLGNLTQTAGAFGYVQGALSWFVDSYPTVATWMAVVERLTSFGEAMERAKELEAADHIRVAPAAGGALRVKNLDVRLPDGATLLDGVSMNVAAGETVSIGGPSGSGKSTLFRVLSGLWPWGEGEVAMPEGGRVLFLPQRSYLPIGTLKDALTYPQHGAGIEDARCREVLEACLLGHLVSRLDENTNWSLALSVGEQQRLAFARALLLEPKWIFIDEGTSALDTKMEAHLYTLLKQRLPGTAIVSIAHRPDVVAVHNRHLNIDPERHALVEGVGTAVPAQA
jgi:putative ATP-binding cassette transporter